MATELTIGSWTVRPDHNQVFRNGVVATLQPLSMDILVFLARRAGDVVSAQELLDTFWQRRSVGDDAVHRRIADIRRHLGDDSKSPRYILTIPKRGYQLIANVDWRAPDESSIVDSRPRSTVWLAVLAGIFLVSAGLSSYIFGSRLDEAAIDDAIAMAEDFLEEDAYQSAYDLLQPYLQSKDNRIAPLLTGITLPIVLLTDPPGVEVSYRYARNGTDWISLGVTPIEEFALPRGNYKLKLGDSVLMNATNPGATLNSAGVDQRIIGMPTSDIPDDMVFVPGGNYRLGAWGFDEETDLGPFLADRTEVTNAEYFEFVEAGAYADRDIWAPIISASGGELTWEDIEDLFVDQTGMPGPADWSLGSYPPGARDLPVTGVSWYEANAYLAFRGKTLPTVHHWLRIALGPMEWKYPFATFLVPESNVGGTELLAVGSRQSAESGGAFDLIGNAAEWTSTAGTEGKSVVGASFRDAAWAYNFPRSAKPLQRRNDVGFRGIRRTDRSNPDPPQHIDMFTDFTSTVRHISDEMFEGIRLNYQYREGTLNARDAELVEEREFDQWIRRLIHLPGGHDNNPLPVYLYLPKRQSAPLQSIIYLPPADSWATGFRSESVQLENYQLDFIPRAGRALIWPVFFGSHERYDDYHAAPVAERARLALERNRRIRDEIGRVIDFLQSSPEFDGERVGLIGLSYGATLASYNLATEKRIRAAVLYSVGLAAPNPIFANPQNDPNVYWARVTQPTLIINGRYDPLRPHHFVLEPLVNLLGTPPELKKSLLYESSHWPLPRYQLMRDSLDWFDQHLGMIDAPARSN
jgi:DNA-binding winged helix-turn-helix (wHTH) protein/formylglycine-generating enzyme required for sulfatase activity